MACENDVAKSLTKDEEAFVKVLCALHSENGLAAYISFYRHIRFQELERELILEGVSSTEFAAQAPRIFELFAQGKRSSEIKTILNDEKRAKQRAEELSSAIKKHFAQSSPIASEWVTWHQSVEAELDIAIAGLEPPADAEELVSAAKRIAGGANGADINAEFRAGRPQPTIPGEPLQADTSKP
jgi:hypothetical protein